MAFWVVLVALAVGPMGLAQADRVDPRYAGITDQEYLELGKWLLGFDSFPVRKWGVKDCALYRVQGACRDQSLSCLNPGVDYAGTSGRTEVLSVSRGVVTSVVRGCRQRMPVCRSWVAIYSQEAEVTFFYLHLEGIYVSLGERVEPGQVIGTVGYRGSPGGAWLHFEAQSGARAKPATCIDAALNPYQAARRARVVGAGLAGAPVQFPDPYLEAAVRRALGRPTGPITAEELAALVSLDAPQQHIADLSGLEHATGLRSLSLADNQISDLSPLAALTSLKWLWLDGNMIVDLSPLAHLEKLQHLSLAGNLIANLFPLSELAGLVDLVLADNRIVDISPLAGLVGLNRLDLRDNRIEDITPLLNILGPGDSVDLRYNYLDTDPGSEAMGVVQAFLARGVEVLYEPQKPTS